MAITKASLNMISGGSTVGNVESSGRGLSIVADDEVADTLEGYYDNTSGTLTLSIPGYPVLRINNFMTQSDVGTGKEGPQGVSGNAGINGLLGENGLRGERGCRGPRGPVGERGVRGAQGKQGEQGPIGATGPQGEHGLDGKVSIYITTEDPGPVGAGALWIKPR